MPTKAVVRELRRFAIENKGTSVIEFAAVVPVLLALYLCAVDLSLGFTIKRKLQHATSTMNDLVSRTNNVSASDLEGILDMGDATMAPRVTKLDTSKITGVTIDATGKATVSWSRARNVNPDIVGNAVVLPANLASMRSVGLVWSTAAYTYKPKGGFGLASDFLIESEVWNATRTGTSVTCSNC